MMMQRKLRINVRYVPGRVTCRRQEEEVVVVVEVAPGRARSWQREWQREQQRPERPDPRWAFSGCHVPLSEKGSDLSRSPDEFAGNLRALTDPHFCLD
ncbi:hypothetical protein scyTo_0000529 [Scyliorhinus torazame]|uniref:Uncharacterized protein n=1 Tax=Scyliorhinus torazame TaxID=75743 RepID=A0A401NYT8_SCYTO|nr:hypothetical protein [Scyliorhinus torazame]